MDWDAQLLSWTVFYLLLGSPAVVALWAWFCGRPAERYGAALYCVVTLGGALFQAASGQLIAGAPELVIDTIAAGAFLYLALRYNSLWLGVALLIKGAQFALHAVHLTDNKDVIVGGFNLYLVGLNAISLLFILTFAFAILSSMRDRRRASSNAVTTPAQASAAALSA